jgi:hypothetical protein
MAPFLSAGTSTVTAAQSILAVVRYNAKVLHRFTGEGCPSPPRASLGGDFSRFDLHWYKFLLQGLNIASPH